jgi:RNA polymerase sigma factor (sigma-70 family)
MTMDTNPSCLATIVLDARAHDLRPQAIADFVTHRRDTLVVWAERLIQRYYLADPAFGADDAVQDAFLKLCQALRDGQIYSIKTEEEPIKLIGHLLNQEILDEREREGAVKRSGSGACKSGRTSSARHLTADFDTIDPQASPPHERVIAEEAVERMLALLDDHDAYLRVVATKKAEGFTRGEIAAQLGESLSAVKRQVRLIKAILGGRRGGLA